MKLPRFNLRDLFWLVLVAALGCAWWMENRVASKLKVENASLRQELVTAKEFGEALVRENANLAAAGSDFIAHLDKAGFDVTRDGPSQRHWRVERRSEKP